MLQVKLHEQGQWNGHCEYHCFTPSLFRTIWYEDQSYDVKYLILKYLTTFRKVLMYDEHFYHEFMLTSLWKKVVDQAKFGQFGIYLSLVTNLNTSDSSIGSDDGLTPIRRHAFIWTNVGLGYRRTYASLGLNELKHETAGRGSVWYSASIGLIVSHLCRFMGSMIRKMPTDGTAGVFRRFTSPSKAKISGWTWTLECQYIFSNSSTTILLTHLTIIPST